MRIRNKTVELNKTHRLSGRLFEQKGFLKLQPWSQFLFVSHTTIIWKMQSKVSKTFFVAAIGSGGAFSVWISVE